MKAQITNKNGYRCAPSGAVVEFYPFGALVDGKVAALALEDGAAVQAFDPRTEAKVIGPDEVKAAPKKRGRPRKTKGTN